MIRKKERRREVRGKEEGMRQEGRREEGTGGRKGERHAGYAIVVIT